MQVHADYAPKDEDNTTSDDDDATTMEDGNDGSESCDEEEAGADEMGSDNEEDEDLNEELNFVDQVVGFVWYKGNEQLDALEQVKENLKTTKNGDDKLLYVQFKQMKMRAKDTSERSKEGNTDQIASCNSLIQEGSFDVLTCYLQKHRKSNRFKSSVSEELWAFSLLKLEEILQDKDRVEAEEEKGQQAFAKQERAWKRKPVHRLGP